MTPAPDIGELRRAEERSREVLASSLKRLKQLAAIAMSPAAQDAIQAQISEVHLALETAEIVAARLGAASVTIRPLEAQTAERLSTLTGDIDRAIEQDAVVTASFVGLAALIEAAGQINSIISSAISPTVFRAGDHLPA